MRNRGLSDRIRALAKDKYVVTALRQGKRSFSISVRSVLTDLEATDFPTGHTPQICSSLQGNKFLEENGLEIVKVDGPPSKQSPTVVVHYRVRHQGVARGTRAKHLPTQEVEESAGERAVRLTERLRGLLKEELAAYGGGEAFLKWVRSEDEDAA